MPLLFIHATNAEFHSRDEGQDYADPETALASGVSGAIALAADEMVKGKTSTAIEVCVKREDGTTVLRSVVSMSVSPIMVAA